MNLGNGLSEEVAPQVLIWFATVSQSPSQKTDQSLIKEIYKHIKVT